MVSDKVSKNMLKLNIIETFCKNGEDLGAWDAKEIEMSCQDHDLGLSL